MLYQRASVLHTPQSEFWKVKSGELSPFHSLAKLLTLDHFVGQQLDTARPPVGRVLASSQPVVPGVQRLPVTTPLGTEHRLAASP